jgi:hypothetical protein
MAGGCRIAKKYITTMSMICGYHAPYAMHRRHAKNRNYSPNLIYSVFPYVQVDDVLGFGFEATDVLEAF